MNECIPADSGVGLKTGRMSFKRLPEGSKKRLERLRTGTGFQAVTLLCISVLLAYGCWQRFWSGRPGEPHLRWTVGLPYHHIATFVV